MAEDHYYSGDGVLAKPQNTTNSPTDTEFLEGDPTTLTRSRRERALDKLNKLKLGMGGNKARRGSTPRTSLVGAPTVLVGGGGIAANGGGGGGERNGTMTRAIKTNGTGITSPSYGEANSIGTRSMEQLNERLQRLKADATRSGSRVAADAQSTPFRVKFVNSKGEATMADVYPNEDFKDIVQQVTEKLRMSRRSDYVLMYRDTDDEEIGVACTDNLREMFSLFEPGSRLQLRIVPFNIINSGALDTIANIWEYSQTPNIFISSGAATPAGEEDGDDVASDASTNNDLDLSKIEIENLKHENEQKPEMAEKPKPSGSAIEDITDAAVAAAAASSAAAAAIAASKADEAAAAAAAAAATTTASAADSPPSSTQTQAASSPKPEASPDNGGKASDAEGLRQAITMMGANLALAIDSLGTKLTRNFDQLSTEQGKILGVLKAASEKPEPAAVVVTEITVEENDEEEKKKQQQQQQQQQEAEEAEKKKKQQQEEAEEAEKKKKQQQEEEEAKKKKEEEEAEKEKKKKEEQDEVEAEIRKAHEEEERLLREEEEKLLQEEMQLLEEEAKLLREREEEKQKQEEAAKKKEERKKLDEEAKKKMDEERKKIEEDRKRVEEVRKRIEDERKKMEEERMQKMKEEEIENIKIMVAEEKPAAAEEAKKKKGEVKFAVENSRDSDEETINVEIFDETRSDISNHSSTSAGSGRTKMSETIDVKATESAGAATHTESIKVHVEEPAHRPAAPAPAPSHAPDATKAFAYHLSAANFAFHSNPYSSSFFKHGFAEADMPSHFSHPCMMASPFECVSSCSCTHGNSCPACTHVNTH